MVSSTVEIADDGTFKCEVKGFSADKYYESVCSGVITNLKKISDNKYTFNCSDTVIDDEPETRNISGKTWTIEHCDNDFDTTDELFDELFGNLYVGKHPTPDRNKYLVLKMSFSSIVSDPEKMEASFNSNCDMIFTDFCLKIWTISLTHS